MSDHAPRTFERAAGLYLAASPAFTDNFRRDPIAQCWRRRDEDGLWRRADEITVVTDFASAVILDGFDVNPPLEFRAVSAPIEDTAWERYLSRYAAWSGNGMEPSAPSRILTVEDLAASTSWLDARNRLARLRGFPVPATTPLLTPRQVAKLRVQAETYDCLYKALRVAGSRPECQYVPTASPVEVDPTAWLDEVTELAVPTAFIGTRELHAAYVDAVKARDPHVRPLGATQFRRKAEKVFGSPARHMERGDVYEGRAWRVPMTETVMTT